jgi:hypothetical protein
MTDQIMQLLQDDALDDAALREGLNALEQGDPDAFAEAFKAILDAHPDDADVEADVDGDGATDVAATEVDIDGNGTPDATAVAVNPDVVDKSAAGKKGGNALARLIAGLKF